MDSESVEYLALCLPTVVLHELGHICVARLMGLRIKRFGVSWKGPYLVREQGSPWANLCTALAGPVMNLVLGVSLWSVAPRFALVNTVLGCYNLLPFIPGLDGHHALAAFRKLSAMRPASSWESGL